MLRNYLIVAIRAAFRDRLYSTINLLGLSVGLAAAGLIGLYVAGELRYDSFHTRGDRIYHVVMGTQDRTGATTYSMGSFGDVGESLRDAFPGVEETLRLLTRRVLIRMDDTAIYQDQCLADSSIFRVMTLPLQRGDSATALVEPWSMVISESMARRFFGEGDPIGETVISDDDAYIGGTYRITGVFEDLPAASHVAFDCVTSTARTDNQLIGSWGPYLNVSHPTQTYVLLREGADVGRIETGLPAFSRDYIDAHRASQLARNAPAFDGTTFHLHALRDVYLHSRARFGIQGMGSAESAWTFATIAALILALACCNYTNLATARSLHRVREVGLRRVVGARRQQLVTQFLGESLVTTFGAAVAALGLVEAALPEFARLIGRPVTGFPVYDLRTWALLVIVVGAVGLVSGAYPAFVLSRYRLRDVLNRTGRLEGGALRSALVTLQFGVSIALIICTVTLTRQMAFIRSVDLGFDRDLLVTLPFGTRDRGLIPRMDEVKRALSAGPGVEATTSGIFSLTRPLPSPVTAEGEALDSRTMVRMGVDEDFLETMGVGLVAGRFFSRDHPTDEEEAFLLNETAVRELGWTPESAVGKTFAWRWKKGRVIGVLADFNLESLYEPSSPAFFMMWKEKRFRVTARISGTQVERTLAHMESVWNRFLPDHAFEFTFMNDNLAAAYLKEEKRGRVFTGLAALAVGIACLGLLGLSAFSVERRTKEIGIRKVVGASARNIVGLLSRDVVKLIAVANIVAWPAAWYVSRLWLNGFAFRIEMGAAVFLVGGGLSLAITVLTVGWLGVRAAWRDPVESLRCE